MAGTSARRLVRAAIPSVAALAVVAGLSGCKAGQVALSTQSTSPAAPAPASSTAPAPTGGSADPASTTAAPAATRPASGPAAAPASGSATSGSVSVSVTSPVTLSGTASVPVSCVTGVYYRAEVSSAVIHGDQVSWTVAIARYRGPGSYPAVVAVTLRQSTGVVTTIAGVSRVPAVITAAGGSFSVSATGSAGRTFTGSLNWTCGT